MTKKQLAAIKRHDVRREQSGTPAPSAYARKLRRLRNERYLQNLRLRQEEPAQKRAA